MSVSAPVQKKMHEDVLVGAVVVEEKMKESVAELVNQVESGATVAVKDAVERVVETVVQKVEAVVEDAVEDVVEKIEEAAASVPEVEVAVGSEKIKFSLSSFLGCLAVCKPSKKGVSSLKPVLLNLKEPVKSV